MLEKQFPVKPGDWVEVGGEWRPKAFPARGHSGGKQVNLSLFILQSPEEISRHHQDTFRVLRRQEAAEAQGGGWVLVHHTQWNQPGARQIAVNTERPLPLRPGDWVRLRQDGDWEPGR
ncbi:MAG: hypothetical protein R3257_07955 [bacterium]|nr:hypothetical protein [bacterium]